MWIRPTGETTKKKNTPCCLPQGGVETATTKQIFFGKFEKLWKIFRIFESMDIFQNIEKIRKKILVFTQKFCENNRSKLKSMKKKKSGGGDGGGAVGAPKMKMDFFRKFR